MRTMLRTLSIIFLVGLASSLFSPCAAIGAEEEIRIGVYLPMTGSVAAFGQMAWAGVQVAHQMEPNVLGRPVRLFLVDEKSDKIEAANAVSRLITKEKVQAIIGSATSSDTLAGAPIAEEAKVPMITPTATNPLVTQNKKYIFRVCFIDPFQGKVAAHYAYENLKARRAAVLTDIGQDYSVGLANFFKEEFKKLGGAIVAETFCQTNDQDFSAQLSSIKAANPDVLYLPNYYTEDALTARQAKELGITTPLLSGDGAEAEELLKIGGKAVEGMAFTGHFHKDSAVTPVSKKFVAKFQAEKKEDPSAFNALGADAYLLLLDAINRAKSMDGDKIRAALASTKNWEGVSGSISIGADGNAVKSVVILNVKNGAFHYLTTIKP